MTGRTARITGGRTIAKDRQAAAATATMAQGEEKRDAVFHPHAFRHKVLLSDEIYPESWRNLKKDGKAGASDEL